MISTVVLFVALNASDTLVKAQVGDLSLKLPQSKDWRSEESAETNGKSRAVSSTDGEAQIDLRWIGSISRLISKLISQKQGSTGLDGHTLPENTSR